jgi:FKBP-type peptidyl-prolyl cis-trans isomerase FkpA
MGDLGRRLARCPQTKVRMIRTAPLFVAMSVAAACNGSPEDVLGRDCTEGEEITSDSGLVYEDLRCGDGAEADHGDALRVEYTGRLSDGSVFDGTAPGEALEFLLDADIVIAGWSEGIDGMREGGRRRLEIPPELGYGDDGLAGKIPPGATVTYVVELVEVRKPAE